MTGQARRRARKLVTEAMYTPAALPLTIATASHPAAVQPKIPSVRAFIFLCEDRRVFSWLFCVRSHGVWSSSYRDRTGEQGPGWSLGPSLAGGVRQIVRSWLGPPRLSSAAWRTAPAWPGCVPPLARLGPASGQAASCAC